MKKERKKQRKTERKRQTDRLREREREGGGKSLPGDRFQGSCQRAGGCRREWRIHLAFSYKSSRYQMTVIPDAFIEGGHEKEQP